MKYLLAPLLLFSLFVHAQAPSVAAKINIFTYGDSNGTFPYSWPVQLKNIIPNADVFNISKSGKTVGFVNNGDSTLNALLTIDKDLKKAADFTGNRPFDYIVIELGTNDAKAVFADRQGEVAANLKALISKFRNSSYASVSKAKVIIISPPPYGSKAEAQAKYTGGRSRVEQMSRTFKKIARKAGAIFINGFKTPGLDMETMSADGLHMNAEGSKKLVEPVAAIIGSR